jgi:hypothetical protein
VPYEELELILISSGGWCVWAGNASAIEKAELLLYDYARLRWGFLGA